MLSLLQPPASCGEHLLCRAVPGQALRWQNLGYINFEFIHIQMLQSRARFQVVQRCCCAELKATSMAGGRDIDLSLFLRPSHSFWDC